MIKIGDWYWAAGRGPVKITALPDAAKQKTTVTVRPFADTDVWVTETDLRPLSSKTMRMYEHDLLARVKLTETEEEGLAACKAWLLENRK